LIAYGCVVGDRRRYRSCALPAIERLRSPEDLLIEIEDGESIFRAYNEILGRAREVDGLEALVLIHEDAEIVDPRFVEEVRDALADESVAIVGVLGGIGVTGIDWWSHDQMIGAARYRSVEPFPSWGKPLIGDGTLVGPGGAGDVDSLDGLLLILSPWAIEELEFDEALGPGFHGYDADLCFQARERGRRVIVADLEVDHHQRQLFNDAQREAWKRAHVAFRRKWEHRGLASVADGKA